MTHSLAAHPEPRQKRPLVKPRNRGGPLPICAHTPAKTSSRCELAHTPQPVRGLRYTARAVRRRYEKSQRKENNVPNLRRAPTGLVASGAVALGLFCGAGVTSAEPVPHEVMLDNAQTGKCLTIAGGVSMDNNVPAVQFSCDSDPSRRWRLAEMGGGVYQIRNVQTGKCLTIAGGRRTDNNVQALQFNCDSDPSRTWRINDVTGSGLHQIRNVQTNKCLTIAGGRSTDNNVEALQFDCDSDPSRTWTIRLKL
jgi:cytolethal distending toxin subunit A